jgi:hypothetical protein
LGRSSKQRMGLLLARCPLLPLFARSSLRRFVSAQFQFCVWCVRRSVYYCRVLVEARLGCEIARFIVANFAQFPDF